MFNYVLENIDFFCLIVRKISFLFSIYVVWEHDVFNIMALF